MGIVSKDVSTKQSSKPRTVLTPHKEDDITILQVFLVVYLLRHARDILFYKGISTTRITRHTLRTSKILQNLPFVQNDVWSHRLQLSEKFNSCRKVKQDKLLKTQD